MECGSVLMVRGRRSVAAAAAGALALRPPSKAERCSERYGAVLRFASPYTAASPSPAPSLPPDRSHRVPGSREPRMQGLGRSRGEAGVSSVNGHGGEVGRRGGGPSATHRRRGGSCSSDGPTCRRGRHASCPRADQGADEGEPPPSRGLRGRTSSSPGTPSSGWRKLVPFLRRISPRWNSSGGMRSNAVNPSGA